MYTATPFSDQTRPMENSETGAREIPLHISLGPYSQCTTNHHSLPSFSLFFSNVKATITNLLYILSRSSTPDHSGELKPEYLFVGTERPCHP